MYAGLYKIFIWTLEIQLYKETKRKYRLTHDLFFLTCLLLITKTAPNPSTGPNQHSTGFLSSCGKQSSPAWVCFFHLQIFVQTVYPCSAPMHTPFLWPPILFPLIALSPLIFSHLTPSPSLWYPFYQTLSLSSALRQFPSVLVPSLLSYLALHSCLQCHSHFTDDCAASRARLPHPLSCSLSLPLYPSA